MTWGDRFSQLFNDASDAAKSAASAALSSAKKAAKVVAQAAVDAGEPVTSTPEQLTQLIRDDVTRFARIVRLAGIQPE